MLPLYHVFVSHSLGVKVSPARENYKARFGISRSNMLTAMAKLSSMGEKPNIGVCTMLFGCVALYLLTSFTG